MATEQQLLNIIFDDSSAPQEKANAVTALKKITHKDRDQLVLQFNPKKKRSPPRERPRPQDAKRIKELEDKIEAIPTLVMLFYTDHRYRSVMSVIAVVLSILALSALRII
jgi:hypothetical protein